MFYPQLHVNLYKLLALLAKYCTSWLDVCRCLVLVKCINLTVVARNVIIEVDSLTSRKVVYNFLKSSLRKRTILRVTLFCIVKRGTAQHILFVDLIYSYVGTPPKSTTKPPQAWMGTKRFGSTWIWRNLLDYRRDMLWLDNWITFHLRDWLDFNDDVANTKTITLFFCTFLFLTK